MKADELNRKQRLFSQINTLQARFEPSLGTAIRCPVCWTIFGTNAVELQLSVEHVGPASTAKLLGESTLETLTCKSCNNRHGSKHQDDLKHFVIHRLWEAGQYAGQIPGEVTIPGSSALRCNIRWDSKQIQIIGVPKANNPRIVEEHENILKNIAETGTKHWSFSLNGQLGYQRNKVWNSYLHSAYLVASVRTGYMYSFSRAGTMLRELILRGSDTISGAPIIPVKMVTGGCRPWLAEVNGPSEFGSIWVKVAGSIVILPLPDTIESASLYEAWWNASTSGNFGLIPNGNIPFGISFFTEEDLAEARKCLPASFGETKFF